MSAPQFSIHTQQSNFFVYILVLFFTIITDQVTKFLAIKLYEAYNELSFLHNFFQFSLIKNYGGFLGIVNNFPDNIRFFLLNVCVSFLLSGCLVYIFWSRNRTSRYSTPLVFVVGGGISNLVDRLLYDGGVVDFLSIGAGSFRTGIFNLADVYILVGSFVIGCSFFSSPVQST
jgi:signal peptidase II